jgi:hypothetical protein
MSTVFRVHILLIHKLKEWENSMTVYNGEQTIFIYHKKYQTYYADYII